MLLGGPYSSTGFRAIPAVFPGAVSGSESSFDTTVAHIQKPLSDFQKDIGLI